MKYKKQILLSALASSMILVSTANAAEKTHLADNAATILAASQNSASLLATNPAQMVGLSSENSLAALRSFVGTSGETTIRYQQLYKGIPVIGDHAIISHNADGSFRLAHGAVLNGIEQDIASTMPRIKRSSAVSAAKQTSASNEDRQLDSAINYENESSRLAIWQDQSGVARLVYEITYVQHASKPSRPYIIVDAYSGDILYQLDNLQFANGTGPGGNTKTGQYEYGTDYGFLDVTQSGSNCTMNNANVKTINLNGGTTGTNAWSYACPRNTTKAINGAFAPLNDAHYFGAVVFNMYKEWLNSAPLTFQLTMRVHYSVNYENAFWDGRAMTFGDGHTRFHPLVSLDVSAHEVSHGYTEQNSKLVYSGKSGGLNESFSDIAGEAAEFYMKGTNDWLVGEQIFKSAGALRYMNTPTKDGRSIDNQANYRTGMDVHYSSGVFNKAFYLLATKTGWDTKKAFIVYANANKLYWSASTDWDKAGNGVMDAACDLGYVVADVKSSLASVGVSSNTSPGRVCGTDPNPPVPGDELINGVARTGLSANTGDVISYTMTVPAGATNIKFAMSEGTGDADLYVKFGSAPTDTNYDCRPYRSGNTESCTSTKNDGIFHVRIKAFNTFADAKIVGSYTQ